MLKKLNFPEYQFRVSSDENKFMIFDELRKKFVRLTDEEWVRQHMVRYLIREKEIPRSLLRVESGTRYDRLSKRTDIAIYKRSGAPFMIIECKAPWIKIDQSVLYQTGIYGKSIRPDYLGITNGMIHYFWSVNYDDDKVLLLDHFPVYS